MPAEQLCVFCAASAATPATTSRRRACGRSPAPRLITVPACTACNAGADLDDEFVQRMAIDGRH
jgi:hypothetical protein